MKLVDGPWDILHVHTDYLGMIYSLLFDDDTQTLKPSCTLILKPVGYPRHRNGEAGIVIRSLSRVPKGNEKYAGTVSFEGIVTTWNGSVCDRRLVRGHIHVYQQGGDCEIGPMNSALAAER